MIPLLFMALFSWSTLLSSAMQRYSNQSCNKRRHSDVSGTATCVMLFQCPIDLSSGSTQKKKKRKTYLSYHRLVLITGEALQCPVQLDQSGQPAETVMSSDAANTLSLKGNKARNQFN